MAFPQVFVVRPQCVDEVNASGHHVTASGEAECVQSPYSWPWGEHEMLNTSLELIELVCLRVEEAMATVVTAHTSDELVTRLPLVESLIFSIANSAVATLGFQVCSFRIAHLAVPVEDSSRTEKDCKNPDHKIVTERDQEPVKSPDWSCKKYESGGQQRKRRLENSCEDGGSDRPEPKRCMATTYNDGGSDLLEQKELPVALGKYDDSECQEPKEIPVGSCKIGGNNSSEPNQQLEMSCEDSGRIKESKKGPVPVGKLDINTGPELKDGRMGITEPKQDTFSFCKDDGEDGQEPKLPKPKTRKSDESRELKQCFSTEDDDSDVNRVPKQHPTSPCKGYENNTPEQHRNQERKSECDVNNVTESKQGLVKLKRDAVQNPTHRPLKDDINDTLEPKHHTCSSCKDDIEDGEEPKRLHLSSTKDDSIVTRETKQHPTSPCKEYGINGSEPKRNLEGSCGTDGICIKGLKQHSLRSPIDDSTDNSYCEDDRKDFRDSMRHLEGSSEDDKNHTLEPNKHLSSSSKYFSMDSIDPTQHLQGWCEGTSFKIPNQNPLNLGGNGDNNVEEQSLTRSPKEDNDDTLERKQDLITSSKDDSEDGREQKRHLDRSFKGDVNDSRISDQYQYSYCKDYSPEQTQQLIKACNDEPKPRQIILPKNDSSDTREPKQELTKFLIDNGKEPKRRLRKSRIEDHSVEAPEPLRMRLRSRNNQETEHRLRCPCCEKINLQGHPDMTNRDVTNGDKVEKKQKHRLVGSRRSDTDKISEGVASITYLASKDEKAKGTTHKKTRRYRRGTI